MVRRIFRRQFSYANVVATLALVFALGGGAYAAIAPVRDGVVHTCYGKSSGALRVVNAGQRCGRRERALNLNQRGPRGFTGPRGATGPTGKTGATGKRGATGARGATGPAGVSVTSAALAAGNANCPAGGASFSSASGTTFACNGSAVAFASVGDTGTLSAQHGVVADAVMSGSPGVYCFKLAVTPSVGVASVHGAAGPGFAQVQIPAGSACAATGDTTAEVLTFSAGGTAAALPFDVMFG